MEAPIERADYYFDDCAPDGWHEYHLQRIGTATPELYRDGKPLRDAMDAQFLADNKLLQPQALVALESLVRNAGKSLDRMEDFSAVSEIEAYLTGLRRLFNDTKRPYRVIKNAGVGRLVFALDVWPTPSKYRSGYRIDLKQHWRSSAAGAGTIFRGKGYCYFTGRHNALHEIVGWLEQPSSGGSLLVVTGDPGSGKSALLGLLVTASDISAAADDSLCALIETMPAFTRPPRGIFDFTMHLKGKTFRDVQLALADCFHSQPDDVFDWLDARDKKTVLAFDALEEASEPGAIAAQLCSLIRQDNIWLLIGSQRSELRFMRPYSERVTVIDLNQPEFADDTDLASYVEQLLLTPDHAPGGNPYTESPTAAREAAAAVSAAAQGNFLVAQVLAQYLVNRKTIADLDRERLPSVTEQAFKKYLQSVSERLGWTEQERLALTIRPLAYAEGVGMPRAIWKALLREGTRDVDAVLRQECALIGEYRDDEQTLYRLYHDSLARALRDNSDETEDQAEIVDTLVNSLPDGDWRQADWYTRRHLAAHAAKARLLDQLLLNTAFLAVADPARLLAVADSVRSSEGIRRLGWYRLALDRVSGEVDPADRLGCLELVAHQAGAKDLAQSASQLGWSPLAMTCWAIWQPLTPHLVLKGHEWPVTAVATDGDIVVSGSRNGTVRLWDCITGRPIGEPQGASSAEVTSVAIKGSVAVAGYEDGSLLFWNHVKSEILAHNATGYSTWAGDAKAPSRRGIVEFGPLPDFADVNKVIPAEECRGAIDHTKSTERMGREVVAVGIYDDFFLVCYSPMGLTAWTRSYEHITHPEQVKMAFQHAQQCGDLVIHSRHEASIDTLRSYSVQAIRLSDTRLLITGYPAGDVEVYGASDFESPPKLIGAIPDLHDGEVNAVAVEGEIAASGGDDRTIRLWNHQTPQVIGQPLYGHDGAVLSVDIAKDLIVSGGEDATVRIWRRNSVLSIGQPALAAGNPARSIAIAEDVVCTGHSDDTVRLWDRSTGEPVGSPFRAEWVWRWGGEPEEDAPITSNFPGLTEPPQGRSWKRIDEALRQRVVTEGRPKSWIKSVAANGAFVVAGHQDGTIWLWDRASGRQITEPDIELHRSFNDIGDFVTALALSEDNLLAVGSLHGRVYLWDLNGYSRFDTMDYKPFEREGPHASWVTSFTILQDHIVSLSQDNTAHIWDRHTGQPVGAVQGEFPDYGVPVITDAVFRKNEATGQTDITFPLLPDVIASEFTKGMGSGVVQLIYKDDTYYVLCERGAARIGP